MKHYGDIGNDEMRIINSTEGERKAPLYRRWWFWVALAAALIAAIAVVVMLLRLNRIPETKGCMNAIEMWQDSMPESAVVAQSLEQAGPASVQVADTTINDVPLCLYTPVNVTPELCLGIPDTNNSNLLLAFRAADIRADNWQIVGAFVMKGELLSRGMSKKGFCAIIDGTLHLGLAESTPLLEEAIEHEGYFFRQYPLVSDGKMIDNKPKGKAVRNALCDIDGRTVAVRSLSEESFHDFAQALADLGVQHAVYLSGSTSYGFCRADQSSFSSWGEIPKGKELENINFIVWKSVR